MELALKTRLNTQSKSCSFMRRHEFGYSVQARWRPGLEQLRGLAIIVQCDDPEVRSRCFEISFDIYASWIAEVFGVHLDSKRNLARDVRKVK